MGITFACPGCGRRFGARDEHAGRRSRCPGCGGEIEVPPLTPVATTAGRTADSPPPVPPIAVGEDLGRSEGDGALDIPGLRADLDDEDEDERLPARPGAWSSPHGSKSPHALPGRPMPIDPWFYGAFELLGTTTVVLACVPVAIFLVVLVAAAAGQVPWGVAGIVFGSACGSLVFFLAGAAVLLVVDVARNIRRLRLHADRDAGIE